MHIDHDVWKQAQKDAVDGRDIDYRDKQTRGMAIRVRGGKAAWYVMTDTFKKRVAGLEMFVPDKVYKKDEKKGNLDELKKLVVTIRELVDTGEESRVDEILSEINKGAQGVRKARERVALKRGEVWTWEQLRDAYLAHVEETLSFKSWQAMCSALGAAGDVVGADFEPLKGKAAHTIGVAEINQVLANMKQRCLAREGATSNAGLSQRQKVLQYIRTMFDWASQHDTEQRRMSGIEINVARLVKKPTAASVKSGKDRKKRGRARQQATATYSAQYATTHQLGDFALSALWYDVEAPIPAKIALLLQLTTGQRISSVLTACTIEFVRVPASVGVPWKYVWALGPDKMGAYRLLPLPDIASWCVHMMKTKHARDGNDFLFPQLKRSKGVDGQQGDADFTMHYSTVKNALKKALKLEDCLPSSFKGTHDSRRCMISHLSEWKELGFDDLMSVERITHKNEGKQTVRQKIYDSNPALRDKFKVLQTWEDMLLSAFDDPVSAATRFSFQDAEDRRNDVRTEDMWAKLDALKDSLNMGGYEEDDED